MRWHKLSFNTIINYNNINNNNIFCVWAHQHKKTRSNLIIIKFQIKQSAKKKTCDKLCRDAGLLAPVISSKGQEGHCCFCFTAFLNQFSICVSVSVSDPNPVSGSVRTKSSTITSTENKKADQNEPKAPPEFAWWLSVCWGAERKGRTPAARFKAFDLHVDQAVCFKWSPFSSATFSSSHRSWKQNLSKSSSRNISPKIRVVIKVK